MRVIAALATACQIDLRIPINFRHTKGDELTANYVWGAVTRRNLPNPRSNRRRRRHRHTRDNYLPSQSR